MDAKLIFTREEWATARELVVWLREHLGGSLQTGDESALWRLFKQQMRDGLLQRDVFGLNPVVSALQTARVAIEDTGLRRDGVVAIILNALKAAQPSFGTLVETILRGLSRTRDLNKKSPVVESENFRNLLLSFAEDMRVILIMIAERVNLMRQIRDADDDEEKRHVSEEAAYLYAPLAHKLGLYKLKSELEDLSLKYLEHDAYYMIREKLNATKKSRDAYIESFIRPVEQQLREAGLNFHMKGRTKSIHSIWQKMKKQKCAFEGIYDLFAIRIIIDAPLEKEKMQCWQ
ncbi:MAG: bifunctional (p)ppGpp synthetase/guanosine-3',5'-bis(diphosphate) 3'-pyrophosphohydrolase, partial [Prevotella sp.]|nr:bifunctional (p)ppGpp synthetase/guanosine-3',5'-bis(diphosphate) 3'-pyrophosphohydrolase [Prevotella sp.]